MTEDEWWQNLTAEDITANAYGVPPYELQPVIDIIESHISFRDMVLDLGCGPGRLGHELARRHPESLMHGMDVSFQMLAMARYRAPDNWLVTPVIILPSDCYQGAYAVTVFQHLPHDVVRGYLARIYAALVDGGRFIFTFAIGDEDTFLSHQVPYDTMLEWTEVAGFEVVWHSGQRADGKGTPWSWVVGEK